MDYCADLYFRSYYAELDSNRRIKPDIKWIDRVRHGYQRSPTRSVDYHGNVQRGSQYIFYNHDNIDYR